MTDTMLEKVRKLLAKAEDPACTPHEAAALNDKAAELVAKYGIDRALLAATALESDIVGDQVVAVLAPYALDKAGLLATVANALRCRSVRRKVWRGQGYAYDMHLFGFASDLERVELLYTSLLVQAAYGIAAAVVPEWDNPAAFRRSWLVGFTQAVGARLRAAEQRAASEAEASERARAHGSDMAPRAVSLVLADRDDLVKRRVDETYPRLLAAEPRRLLGSGGANGYAAGRRADLGGVRLGRPDPRGVTRR
jgi:uncharacterized protein DUF2786